MLKFLGFSIFWLTNVAVNHPFHVSVVDMEYETQEKHLKISCSIFLDDLEEALQLQSGNDKLDILKDSTIEKEIEVYFETHFNVKKKGKNLPIKYVGSEVEVDVMWSYLEVENLKDFKTLEVESTILLELFDDQENLVHIRRNGEVRSLRLMKDREYGSLTWDVN